MHKPTYRGRFAPSPTGPLHLGSLVAGMASWLDARAHGGAWSVRIEDIDPPREIAGASDDIMATLADFGFEWSSEPTYQSQHDASYQKAFNALSTSGWIYPCSCSRKEIADSHQAGDQAHVYPGTCRNGLPPGREARAWRMRIQQSQDSAQDSTQDHIVSFHDRWLGPQQQNLLTTVGDFVLKRADGLWAYQLAVVVDDGAQGITDVVRGADLLDSTSRQIHLQQALGLSTPRYLHVPVVTHANGEKLSKQTSASALDRAHPLAELRHAARHLGLPEPGARQLGDFWKEATTLWTQRWRSPSL